MATPLLKTKLYAPPVRFGLVSRLRLIERLNEGLRAGHRLTLLSAPAGFGKTTLLSDWAAACHRPVAWVSLDEGDDDPIRFWSYVVAALRTAQPDTGAMALAALQTSRGRRLSTVSPSRNGAAWIDALLTGLINDLVECPDPLVLVLDDLHLITGRQNHNALVFLVDSLPPQVHLVCATRTDPPWPLARMRARGELTELRARELRFTLDEARTFLNEAHALALSAEDVAALDARTEGWVAGLQMAALSMRELGDRSAFVERLGGAHRFILDYLVEEVLSRQSDNIQGFLLRTSILQRMTASLCDLLTGRDDSQAVLERLEQDNLFLIPLDDERRWYRYHHLFGDLLRSRLDQTRHEWIPALHGQASKWYERNGLVAEAVRHALAAHDLDRAVILIEENAVAAIYQGEVTTVIGWLEALPKEMVSSRPWLSVAQAWALVYAGRLNAVEPVLEDAERASMGSAQAPGGKHLLDRSAFGARRIRGHTAAIRAYAAFLEWDGRRGMEHAREALACLTDQDLAVRGLAAMVLAIGLYGCGDLEAADGAFAEALCAGKAANDTYVTANALCELTDLQVAQGQLRKAAATCREALQVAGVGQGQGAGQLPIAGYAYGRMSVLLREWNRVSEALQHAQRGIALSQYWGQVDALILGHVFLAAALLAAGDRDGGLDAIGEAKRIASDVSPNYKAFVAAREAKLRVAVGDVEGAMLWMRESELGPSDEPCRPVATYIILARVLLAQALSPASSRATRFIGTPARLHATNEPLALKPPLDQALALLTKLLALAETTGANGYAIEILALQAMALQAQGKPEEALPVLARALRLAEPQGYVRTFVEAEALVPLLRQAAARGIRVEYVGMLLDAIERDKAIRRASVADGPALVEPLTERELEVLRLLVVGLPNNEIAGTLFVAVGTVKQHLKHIYGKLGVHNRTEAASHARELGLV